jgi:DNA-binding CsgD family transcriptional regulator
MRQTLNSTTKPDPCPALDFTATLDKITSIDQLNDAAGKALSRYGVTCFAANLITVPGRTVRPGMLFGHKWKDWSQRYNRKGYAEADPALTMLRNMQTPFTWTEAQEKFGSSAGAKVIRDCLDFTGCGEGVVVPVRERDGSVFTAAFCGPKLRTEPEVRPMLHLIGYYYVTRGYDIEFDVGLNPLCPLSNRQIECLQWVHECKSDAEIATILGISKNTVHTHVKVAMRRMSFTNRILAARYAHRSGWLDYPQ